MPFIPNKKRVQIGSTVILNKDIIFPHGVFTKGTEMTVTNYRHGRGWDLDDGYGNEIGECNSANFDVK